MKKKKKSKIIILTFILIAALIVLTFYLMQKTKKPKVYFSNDLKVEINEEVKISDFIKNVDIGEIVSEDKIIDTTKLGKQKIAIEVKYNEKIHNYDFEVEVIDTTIPVIESLDEISIYVGNSIDLLKDVKITDNSLDTNIVPTIEGSYDFNVAGNYTLAYVAQDSSGNKATKNFVLKVIEDENNRVITTSKGYTLKISNGVASINGIVIANKSYALPSNYGNGLTSETINAFNNMKADANAIGLNLYNSSGFRSYYDQQYIYNNYVKRDGKEAADRYSARAGHSEHQTGLAFDLNTIDWSFEYTQEGKWVNDNCHKYGLIIRYPKGKEEITGYMYEPWHLRYVGEELAKALYNNGNWITIEEYFGIDSKY